MIIPRNELELIVLFSQSVVDISYIEIVSIDGSFPDAIVKWNEIEYRVEFEYKSSNFWLHKHNPLECDIVICWKNDDDYSVLPIIELSNPEWLQAIIELTEPREKSANYWKMRASIAENKLLAESNFMELPVSKYYSDIQDTQFVELVRAGMSRNKASLEIYGRGYAGDIANRGKKILGEISAT